MVARLLPLLAVLLSAANLHQFTFGKDFSPNTPTGIIAHDGTSKVQYSYEDYNYYNYDDYYYDYVHPDTKNARPSEVSFDREHVQKSGNQANEKDLTSVVIKKKDKKKKKILTVLEGYFIQGGVRLFGKFADLHDCEKACEITPTCFAGDYNPWLKSCYTHSNLTACQPMTPHKSLTHFKKVPCKNIEAKKGIVVLGIYLSGGLEIKKIDNLQECIKGCANAGNGIARTTVTMVIEGQICCNINFDFATHKCYFHLCPSFPIFTARWFCAVNGPATTPLNALPHPSTVSITFCPDTTF